MGKLLKPPKWRGNLVSSQRKSDTFYTKGWNDWCWLCIRKNAHQKTTMPIKGWILNKPNETKTTATPDSIPSKTILIFLKKAKRKTFSDKLNISEIVANRPARNVEGILLGWMGKPSNAVGSTERAEENWKQQM